MNGNYAHTALRVFGQELLQTPALAKCADTLEVRLGQAICLNTVAALATIIARKDGASMREKTLESNVDSVLAGCAPERQRDKDHA